jgi:hypothetical protein
MAGADPISASSKIIHQLFELLGMFSGIAQHIHLGLAQIPGVSLYDCMQGHLK